MNYSHTANTIEEQIRMMQSRGLAFDDIAAAKTKLGAVRKLGCKRQTYAHSFVNLKRKKEYHVPQANSLCYQGFLHNW